MPNSGSVGGRKPHIFIDARVLNAEPQAWYIGAKHRSHRQRQFARESGVHRDGLKLFPINQGLALPTPVFAVSGFELNLISRTVMNYPLADEFECVFLLLIGC
jgi:hypothetical protein